MSSTTRLGLPLMAAAQAQKHVTHNEALLALDAIVQLAVADRDLSAPPSSPAEGSAYIIGPSATEVWSGKSGQVAAYQDGIWRFYPPQRGWIAYVMDEDICVTWTGTLWRAFGVTAAEILSRLITVDGAGSGVDADLLDGQHGSYYADVAARLGYTPANKAGETFSGAVAVLGEITSGSNAGASAALILNAADAMHRYIDWQRAGSRRFYFGVNTAETGANAGSNMVLEAYSDAGASLGAVWSVVRATRQMTIANVNITGGVVSGLSSLTAADIFVGSNTDTSPVHSVNGASGSNRIVRFLTAGSTRWEILASSIAESGSNAGSDLAVNRFADNGSYTGTPLSISRSTGVVAIPNASITGGTISGLSSLASAGATFGTNAAASIPIVNGPSASFRGIQIQSAGSRRFEFGADNGAEAGSNAGSNFYFNAYDDAGSTLGSVYSVSRATRQLTIPNINVTGGAISGLSSMASQTLSLGSTTMSTPLNTVLATAAGQWRALIFRSGSSTRHIIAVDDSTESGSSAGSNFVQYAIDDAGVVRVGYTIRRSDGQMSIPNILASGGMISGLTSLTAADVIVGSNTDPNPSVIVNGAAGTTRLLSVQTAGVIRWNIILGNNGAETGANAGTDFAINRHSDAGAYIDSPFLINRATGAVTVPNINVTGGSVAGCTMQLLSFTVATLPSAATANRLISVSNGTGNKRLATSDGTNWRFADGTIVS